MASFISIDDQKSLLYLYSHFRISSVRNIEILKSFSGYLQTNSDTSTFLSMLDSTRMIMIRELSQQNLLTLALTMSSIDAYIPLIFQLMQSLEASSNK